MFVHTFKDDKVHRLSDETAVAGIKREIRKEGRYLFGHQAAHYGPGLLESGFDNIFEFAALPFSSLKLASLAQAHIPSRNEKEKAEK